MFAVVDGSEICPHFDRVLLAILSESMEASNAFHIRTWSSRAVAGRAIVGQWIIHERILSEPMGRYSRTAADKQKNLGFGAATVGSARGSLGRARTLIGAWRAAILSAESVAQTILSGTRARRRKGKSCRPSDQRTVVESMGFRAKTEDLAYFAAGSLLYLHHLVCRFQFRPAA